MACPLVVFAIATWLWMHDANIKGMANTEYRFVLADGVTVCEGPLWAY